MKKINIAIIAFILIFTMCSCCLKHQWVDADCTHAVTCAKCGKTEGEALGHKWKDPTCTDDEICTVCSATKDEALGHDFEDATCTKAPTCKVCNTPEGEALGHKWQKATCKSPKTCKVCKATEGEKGDHSFKDFVCEYCSLEDTEGKKTSPRFSFVKKAYSADFFNNEEYKHAMISFDERNLTNFGCPMGSGCATWTPDINKAWHDESDKIINGKEYYYNGGSAASEPTWSYTLTDTEIIVMDSGTVIGRFTMNSDGSIYCTYGNHYTMKAGITYS